MKKFHELEPLNYGGFIWKQDGRSVPLASPFGFSSGQNVLGKVGYNVEGVRRAIQHFQKSGVEVILAHKRKDVEQFNFGDGVINYNWSAQKARTTSLF